MKKGCRPPLGRRNAATPQRRNAAKPQRPLSRLIMGEDEWAFALMNAAEMNGVQGWD